MENKFGDPMINERLMQLNLPKLFKFDDGSTVEK